MRKFAFALLIFSLNAQADPLSDFKSIVKRCQQSYDARPTSAVEYAESTNRWRKRVYAPAKVTYDVRKTDSLVFPFDGHIEIVDQTAVENAADEESARSLEVSLTGVSFTSIRRINFRFSDGRWESVDAKMTGIFKKSEDDPRARPSYVIEGNDSLRKLKGPVTNCLEVR